MSYLEIAKEVRARLREDRQGRIGPPQPTSIGPTQERAAGNHVGVFAEEKHAKLHRAVFGVISTDKLLLGFGDVERRSIALREHRDE